MLSEDLQVNIDHFLGSVDKPTWLLSLTCHSLTVTRRSTRRKDHTSVSWQTAWILDWINWWRLVRPWQSWPKNWWSKRKSLLLPRSRLAKYELLLFLLQARLRFFFRFVLQSIVSRAIFARDIASGTGGFYLCDWCPHVLGKDNLQQFCGKNDTSLREVKSFERRRWQPVTVFVHMLFLYWTKVEWGLRWGEAKLKRVCKAREKSTNTECKSCFALSIRLSIQVFLVPPLSTT